MPRRCVERIARVNAQIRDQTFRGSGPRPQRQVNTLADTPGRSLQRNTLGVFFRRLLLHTHSFFGSLMAMMFRKSVLVMPTALKILAATSRKTPACLSADGIKVIGHFRLDRLTSSFVKFGSLSRGIRLRAIFDGLRLPRGFAIRNLIEAIQSASMDEYGV